MILLQCLSDVNLEDRESLDTAILLQILFNFPSFYCIFQVTQRNCFTIRMLVLQMGLEAKKLMDSSVMEKVVFSCS